MRKNRFPASSENLDKLGLLKKPPDFIIVVDPNVLNGRLHEGYRDPESIPNYIYAKINLMKNFPEEL